MSVLNNKQKGTLFNVRAEPKSKNIRYKDLESLFDALGAIKEERKGSKVYFELNDSSIILHKPHGKKRNTIILPQILEIREFLEKAGVTDG